METVEGRFYSGRVVAVAYDHQPVHAYVDSTGIVWVDTADAARMLDFVQPTNPQRVHWWRFHMYVKPRGIDTKYLKEGSYISEVELYKLEGSVRPNPERKGAFEVFNQRLLPEIKSKWGAGLFEPEGAQEGPGKLGVRIGNITYDRPVEKTAPKMAVRAKETVEAPAPMQTMVAPPLPEPILIYPEYMVHMADALINAATVIKQQAMHLQCGARPYTLKLSEPTPPPVPAGPPAKRRREDKDEVPVKDLYDMNDAAKAMGVNKADVEKFLLENGILAYENSVLAPQGTTRYLGYFVIVDALINSIPLKKLMMTPTGLCWVIGKYTKKESVKCLG